MVRKYILKNGIKTAQFSRLISKLVDFFIVFILSLLFYPLGLLISIVYISLSDAMQSGQSIGKKFMGFAVISLEDGSPCSYRQSIVRNLPFTVPLVLALIPVVGWFLCVFILIPFIAGELFFIFKLESSNRYGDVMAGTSVVVNTPDIIKTKKKETSWFDDAKQPVVPTEV